MINIGKVCIEQEIKEMLQLLTKYKDVIAWSYEELKTYDLDIIVHDVPLKPNAKPFCQRQWSVHPLIEPLIMKEVENLLEEKIIFPIWHSTWVTNLVWVCKKNGEIRLCMDFRNLNQSSQKDNYPLPLLDKVLQIVNKFKMMSFLDGYSGYN